jgi:hypothetical protein
MREVYWVQGIADLCGTCSGCVFGEFGCIQGVCIWEIRGKQNTIQEVCVQSYCIHPGWPFGTRCIHSERGSLLRFGLWLRRVRRAETGGSFWIEERSEETLRELGDAELLARTNQMWRHVMSPRASFCTMPAPLHTLSIGTTAQLGHRAH